MTLMCFIGFEAIKERKLWRFLILVAISYTFHRSSLVFLPFYFIAHKKPTDRWFVICIVAIIVFFMFKDTFTGILANIGHYENYAKQFKGAGSWIFTPLMLLLLIFAIWRYKRLTEIDEIAVILINACIIACALLPTTFIDPTNMRVVYYFSTYIMLLVPSVATSFNSRNERSIVSAAIVVVLFLLYFKDPHPYAFFWQDEILSFIIIN